MLLNVFLMQNIKNAHWLCQFLSEMKNNFFGKNNKSRSSAFRKFLVYQNIICFGWVKNRSLFCVIRFIKKWSFPAKTAVCAYSDLLVFDHYIWYLSPNPSSISIMFVFLVEAWALFIYSWMPATRNCTWVCWMYQLPCNYCNDD